MAKSFKKDMVISDLGVKQRSYTCPTCSIAVLILFIDANSTILLMFFRPHLLVIDSILSGLGIGSRPYENREISIKLCIVSQLKLDSYGVFEIFVSEILGVKSLE